MAAAEQSSQEVTPTEPTGREAPTTCSKGAARGAAGDTLASWRRPSVTGAEGSGKLRLMHFEASARRGQGWPRPE